MQNTAHRILLLGSGGREHALAWKLKQSPRCSQLFIAPGNGGTHLLGQNVQLDPENFEKIGAFCLAEQVTMVVVGPEAPLVAGIVDYFTESKVLSHIKCIGPTRQGAMLEGSKEFAKQFMGRYDIPTALYRAYTNENAEDGKSYLRTHPLPIVLKADGLAAGKGVVICQSHDEALAEYDMMLGGKFGKASATVVIEQFLTGIEFSVFVLTDGKHYVTLPVAKDYKRIGEGDTGLNTGGMGSVSPVPFVDAEMMEKVKSRIILPTIRGISSEQIGYKGFIFFGLINVGGDPYVIEYNCRMGDPETESVIPRMRNEILDLFDAVHDGSLHQHTMDMDPRVATTVVCASGGYPGNYQKGIPIDLPEANAHAFIFHAGTSQANGKLVTNGGRVLAITALAPSLEESLARSNALAKAISYEGKYFRTDIGFDLLSMP